MNNKLRKPGRIAVVLLAAMLLTTFSGSVQFTAEGFAVLKGPARVLADGYASGETIEHTVQAGESLYSISQEYGTTMSAIIDKNNLESTVIHEGQRLLVSSGGDPSGQPGVSESSSGNSSSNSSVAERSSSNVSLNVKDADIRDVLSALAIKMGVNIILVGSADEVTLKVDDVPPVKALELLLQKAGLHYIREGSLIIVGSRSKLEEDFFRQMVLSRFNLRYISASKLDDLISDLDIPLQRVTIDANIHSIWAQGTPQALAKLQELIRAVDRPENRGPEEEIPLKYRQLELTFISPVRAAELLEEAGFGPDNYLALGKRLLVFDQSVLEHWERVESLFKDLDSVSTRENKVSVYQLKNTYADFVESRFDDLNIGDVDIIPLTGDYKMFTQEILVSFPLHLEDQVYSTLSTLDGPRQRIKVPLDDSSSRQHLAAKRELLSELTGVPVGRMRISTNLGDTDNPAYVLWVEETPDKAESLQNMVRNLPSR